MTMERCPISVLKCESGQDTIDVGRQAPRARRIEKKLHHIRLEAV